MKSGLLIHKNNFVFNQTHHKVLKKGWGKEKKGETCLTKVHEKFINGPRNGNDNKHHASNNP